MSLLILKYPIISEQPGTSKYQKPKSSAGNTNLEQKLRFEEVVPSAELELNLSDEKLFRTSVKY